MAFAFDSLHYGNGRKMFAYFSIISFKDTHEI